MSKQVRLDCIDYIKKNVMINMDMTYEALITNTIVQPASNFVNLVFLIYKQKLYSAKCQKRKPTTE